MPLDRKAFLSYDMETHTNKYYVCMLINQSPGSIIGIPLPQLWVAHELYKCATTQYIIDWEVIETRPTNPLKQFVFDSLFIRGP